MNQHYLAALDDFLTLVLPAWAERALRNLFQNIVAADRLDNLFFSFLAVFIVMCVVSVMFDRLIVALRRDSLRWFGLSMSRVLDLGGNRVVVRLIVIMMMVVIVMAVILHAGFA